MVYTRVFLLLAAERFVGGAAVRTMCAGLLRGRGEAAVGHREGPI